MLFRECNENKSLKYVIFFVLRALEPEVIFRLHFRNEKLRPGFDSNIENS